MTQRDYELLARALSSVMPDISTKRKQYLTWAEVVVALSDALEKDNPRFDRMRFQYAATEVA